MGDMTEREKEIAKMSLQEGLEMAARMAEKMAGERADHFVPLTAFARAIRSTSNKVWPSASADFVQAK